MSEQRGKLLKVDTALSSRLKRKILLQVEDNGEGWYVNPDSGKRSYLGTREDAFKIMRESGLGITDADIDKIPKGN